MRTRAEWKRDALAIIDSISDPARELRRQKDGGPGCLLERMAGGRHRIYQEANALWHTHCANQIWQEHAAGYVIAGASDSACSGGIPISYLREMIEELPE